MRRNIHNRKTPVLKKDYFFQRPNGKYRWTTGKVISDDLINKVNLKLYIYINLKRRTDITIEHVAIWLKFYRIFIKFSILNSHLEYAHFSAEFKELVDNLTEKFYFSSELSTSFYSIIFFVSRETFLYSFFKKAFMVKQNSNNGTTLRTRIVRDKTKYNRKQKHKKSFAEAGDFSFIETFLLFFT